MAQPISFPLLIGSSIILPSPTLCSTTAFFTLSILDAPSFSLSTCQMFSSLFCSFRRSVQVSAPYNAILHTEHFTSLFLNYFSKDPQIMLLFLLKASFTIAILCFTSCRQFMLLLILHPKYLKLSSSSTNNNNNNISNNNNNNNNNNIFIYLHVVHIQAKAKIYTNHFNGTNFI